MDALIEGVSGGSSQIIHSIRSKSGWMWFLLRHQLLQGARGTT